MKKMFLLLAASIVTMAACKKSDSNGNTPEINAAKVMFVHTVLNASDTVHIKANDELIAGVSGLTYGTKTNYVNVEPGQVELSFEFANTGIELMKTTADLTDKQHYSVFLTGSPGNTRLSMVSDDLSAPATGNAKVRFVNLTGTGSSSEMKLTTYVGNQTISQDLSMGDVSDFHEVKAGTYDISFADITQAPPFTHEISDEVLSAGKIYTFVIYGLKDGSGAVAIKTMVIKNN